MKRHGWAEHREMVKFYSTHRCRPEHLYPSERRFLPWLATQAMTVLDVGCAAGGFETIWKHFNPRIEYAGVDVSSAAIRAARDLHSGSRFIEGDPVHGVSLPDAAFDVVQALGFFPWEPHYPKALAELWRLTRCRLFFDCRLVEMSHQAQVGEQRMEFGAPWDGTTTTPYVTVAWPALVETLLRFRPARVLGYGYMGTPAANVSGVSDEVCFAVLVVERSASDAPWTPDLCVQLPWEFPAHLAPLVNLKPPEELSNLVPESI